MPARLGRWTAMRRSASRRSLDLGVFRRSWLLARLRRLAPGDREGLRVLAEEMGYSDLLMRRIIDHLVRDHPCGGRNWPVEFRW